MRVFFLLLFLSFNLYAQKKQPKPQSKADPHATEQEALEKIQQEDDYRKLDPERHKKLPTVFPGLSITKTFEEGSTSIKFDSGKSYPVWTAVNVTGEGHEFSALYNHFTDSWWGPAGGNDAFAQKYWSGVYTPEEALQKCAELPPKGKWRLPTEKELQALLAHQVFEQWGSLNPDNNVIMVGQRLEDKALIHFKPERPRAIGEAIYLTGDIEKFLDKDKAMFKYKCILNKE